MAEKDDRGDRFGGDEVGLQICSLLSSLLSEFLLFLSCRTLSGKN
jgi:hypothetical protein